ncbi:MAG: ABC-type sugar transport system, periplasmic component [Anaerocolumna sp.]|jgi:putative aldouronate transport system substrate-binding protein|nr:ABC-type sugar transport system, periplasmic component [Anaerocolumna sp.]
MKNRKLLSILLVIAMVATMLVGCGKKNDGKSTTEPTAAPTTSGEEPTDAATQAPIEPITLTFYNADGQEDPWTDPVAQKITELTGVTLQTDYPIDGDDQRIALMIASQEYPDMIFAKGGTAELVDAGALIDLTDLIEQYGPNIKKLYGDNFSRLKYSEADPSIYTLGSGGVGAVKYATDGTMQLQYAVLADAGYPVPKTLQEYEDLIASYVAKNPTVTGPDGGTYDTIGMTLSTADWHWYITLSNPSGFASGSPDNGQWIVDDANNYSASYKHSAPGQKEYYKWLNHMYDIGLLDPEFATQTHDDYLAKISTGRVLGLADAGWDFAEGVAPLLAAEMYDRSYAGLPITLNDTIKSAALADQGYSGGWGVGITTACEDPEAAIKYLDWLCTDEAQVLTHWGIEGVNYQLDDNGKRFVPEDEYKYSKSDSEYSKKTGVGFHSYPFPEYGDGRVDANGETYTTVNENTKIATYNPAEKAATEAWGVKMLKDIFPQTAEFPVSDYGAVWQTAVPSDSMLSDFVTQADEISWQYLVQVVVCEPSEFDALWDEFQGKLKDAGLEEANAEMTALLQAKAAFWKQ